MTSIEPTLCDDAEDDLVPAVIAEQHGGQVAELVVLAERARVDAFAGVVAGVAQERPRRALAANSRARA